jgi:hypothetical protein
LRPGSRPQICHEVAGNSRADRGRAPLGFRLPSSVDGDELLCHLRAQIEEFHTAGEANGGSYLCQVLAAVGTVGLVMLEAAQLPLLLQGVFCRATILLR